MQTTQGSLMELLGSEKTLFVIPVYQRVYQWQERQLEELWRDIVRAGKLESAHFVGTLLYTPEAAAGELEQLDIIDGQQRTATIMLIIFALVKYLRENDAKVGGLSASDIEQRYLRIVKDGEEQPKLQLSRIDRDTFKAVLFGTELPEQPSERVTENWAFFEDKIEEDGFDPEALWKGLGELLVIRAVLTDDDAPQLVFESLNAKGMPLTTGDLVRNALLVSVDHKEQTRLYHEYWEPIERAFGDDPGSRRLNAAIHAWLAIRLPDMHAHSASEVYSLFKTYLNDEYDGPLDDLLEELRDFCLMFNENYGYNTDKSFLAEDWAKGKAKTVVAAKEALNGGSGAPAHVGPGASGAQQGPAKRLHPRRHPASKQPSHADMNAPVTGGAGGTQPVRGPGARMSTRKKNAGDWEF